MLIHKGSKPVENPAEKYRKPAGVFLSAFFRLKTLFLHFLSVCRNVEYKTVCLRLHKKPRSVSGTRQGLKLKIVL